MDGKNVFITGSTKGIGYAAAQEFIDLGATVFVNGRNADACAEACEKLSSRGGKARSVVGDVSTQEGRERVVEQLSRLCGEIDCLVNNAGTNVRAPALEAEPRDYRRIMDVNLDAVYHLSVALQPFLAQSARLGHDPTIVNVASAAGVARFAHGVRRARYATRSPAAAAHGGGGGRGGSERGKHE